MELLLAAAGIGGAVFFMYANYQRNKKKIVYNTKRIAAIEKHLGIQPPAPDTPEV